MGQITLGDGETSARLTFLAPAANIDPLALPLLDHIVEQAGEWGAFHLLAEVDEDSPTFRTLRQAGFTMYAWQRAWKLPVLDPVEGDFGTWRQAEETDWPAIQSLYGQIVPALLQPVESLPKQVSGLVCRPEGNLQAYITVKSGPEGVWVQPLIPPDSNCAAEQLTGLASGTTGWQPRNSLCLRTLLPGLAGVCPRRPGGRSRPAPGRHGQAPGENRQGSANCTGHGKGTGKSETCRTHQPDGKGEVNPARLGRDTI